VTTDEVGDVQNLKMWLDVNGKRYQNGSTKTMIFNVRADRQLPQPLHDAQPRRSHHHRHTARRGLGIKPNPVYLKPGDVMTLGIEKLGEQRQTVHAWDPALIDG
jgi:2,4-didehydro-3-deoxy-L-rhamnonate hydrolase